MISADRMLQLFNDGDMGAGDWLWRELEQWSPADAPSELSLRAFTSIMAAERNAGKGDRRGSADRRMAVTARNLDRIDAAAYADQLIAKGLPRSDEGHGAFGVAGERHNLDGSTVRGLHRLYCRPEGVTDIHIAEPVPVPQPASSDNGGDEDEGQCISGTGERDETEAA